jgi:hypothetical protein
MIGSKKLTNGSCHAMYVQVFPSALVYVFVVLHPCTASPIVVRLIIHPHSLITCIILLLGDDHSSPFVGLDDLLWCVSFHLQDTVG